MWLSQMKTTQSFNGAETTQSEIVLTCKIHNGGPNRGKDQLLAFFEKPRFVEKVAHKRNFVKIELNKAF